jgi:hypothetical protein
MMMHGLTNPKRMNEVYTGTLLKKNYLAKVNTVRGMISLTNKSM